MRVLLTGHDGYVGSVLTRMLMAAGHAVTGLDNFLYEDCTFGAATRDIDSVRLDVRDVRTEHLRGFDAVIHLAALCDDPLGNMNAEHTYDINHLATVRLAYAARCAHIERFLFASSCGVYGVAADGLLQEDAPIKPVTAYAHSKILAERDLARLADDDFSPTYLRGGTAFGVSPRLRNDLVVNDLVGRAFTRGRIRLTGAGSSWRPVVHVEDVARAFIAVLEAPREKVHDEAFNVGRTSDNYRVRDLAAIVSSVVAGGSVEYADGEGADSRSHCIDCSKLAETLPAFRPRWTVRRGVEELSAAFEQCDLTADECDGDRYRRLKKIQRLQAEGRLGDDLRWLARAPATRRHAGIPALTVY